MVDGLMGTEYESVAQKPMPMQSMEDHTKEHGRKALIVIANK